MDVGSNKSRKDTRAVVSLVARYRSPSTFEYVQEACCDVSVGGMFIKSPDPAAAGTLLKLECEADNGSNKIRGVARVVWLRRDTNEYGPSGMGVKFVKLEPGSRETITRIVQELSAAGIEPQSISSAPESRGKPPGVHAASASARATAEAGPAEGATSTTSAGSGSVRGAQSQPAVATSPTNGRPIDAGLGALAPVPDAQAPVPFDDAWRSSAPPARAGQATSGAPARDSQRQLELVDAAPSAAIETTPSHSPTAAPITPATGRGTRVWWLIAAFVALIIIYRFAKRDTSSSGDTVLPAGPAAAASPTPGEAEPSAEARPAAPAANEPAASVAAQASAGTEPAAPTGPAAATPGAAEQPAEQPAAATVTPAQPDMQAAEKTPPSGAQADTKPAAMPAVDATPAPVAERPAAAAPTTPSAAAAAPPSAAPGAAPAAAATTAASDRPPLAPGQLPYIMSFITRPTGASVTIGTQTVVAPGEMDLGAMPPRVKVTAQKEGYESSSVWLDRETEFVRSGNAIRRRVYLTLPPLPAKAAADAPKQ